MELTQRTTSILKNFARANNSLLILPGNVIYTIEEGKSYVIRAEIEETFDKKIAIYDGLNQFLNTLELFGTEPKPDIEFGESAMYIRSNKVEQMFRYSDAEYIVSPERDPKLNYENLEYEISFDLTYDQIENLKKAANIQKLKHFAVRGKEGKIYLVACDATGNKNSTANEYVLDTGLETEENFQKVFTVSSLDLLKKDYSIQLSKESNIVKFSSSDELGEITYIFPADATAKNY